MNRLVALLAVIFFLAWWCPWAPAAPLARASVTTTFEPQAPTVLSEAPHSIEAVSPDLHELLEVPREGRTLAIMLVLFQLAVMLASAKLLGALLERFSVPGVIGELLAGAIIGPFLLGSLIKLPMGGGWVPLFPAPSNAGEWPVNQTIWSLAQFASIVLLFLTGLHTDLKQFLRYVGPATLVAVAGVVLPFALGAAAVGGIPYFAELARGSPGENPLIPALFIGAILSATSVGITARVLSDIQKLDTPEGVTILGAAVLDDVLGIIALAIVGGIAATGTVSFGAVGIISFKALGVWIVLTGVILALVKPIERLLTCTQYAGAMIGLALALAFICSGIAEFFGLAFIIGAYSVGLGLSRMKIAHQLMDALQPVYDFIVPIFFATLGMLVNFHAMFSNRGVVIMGVVITLIAIFGKVVGCGAAALPAGFNRLGAYRIGIGMLPRGEVALIVAGVGLSQNIIGQNVFGVSIMMTLITTIVAPILLVPAFARGGSGRRIIEEPGDRLPPAQPHRHLELQVPGDMADLVIGRLLDVAARSGWESAFEEAGEEIYLLRSGDDAAQVRRTDGKILIDAPAARQTQFSAFFAEVQRSIAADAAGVTPSPVTPSPVTPSPAP
jgi:Kef-type K+ transport system membrane component KefB